MCIRDRSKVGANVSKLDAASQTFGNMAKAGAAMQETGSQIVNAVLCLLYTSEHTAIRPQSPAVRVLLSVG